jgi:hypothetical protein
MTGVSFDSKIWVKIDKETKQLTMKELWEFAASKFPVTPSAVGESEKEYIFLTKHIFEIITYHEFYENLVTDVFPTYLVRSKVDKLYNVDNKIKLCPEQKLSTFQWSKLDSKYIKDSAFLLKLNLTGSNTPVIEDFVVQNFNNIQDYMIYSKVLKDYDDWAYNIAVPHVHHFIINNILVYDSI